MMRRVKLQWWALAKCDWSGSPLASRLLPCCLVAREEIWKTGLEEAFNARQTHFTAWSQGWWPSKGWASPGCWFLLITIILGIFAPKWSRNWSISGVYSIPNPESQKPRQHVSIAVRKVFAKIRKVFAIRWILLLSAHIHTKTVWITRKLSGQPQNCPYNPKTFRTIQKPSGHSRNCPDNIEMSG